MFPFALNKWSGEIKWRKVYCPVNSACVKPINQQHDSRILNTGGIYLSPYMDPFVLQVPTQDPPFPFPFKLVFMSF